MKIYPQKTFLSSVVPAFLCASALVNCVFAGGGGQNLLLVVNPSDENSLRVANAYQQLRDIPDCNIVFVDPPDLAGFDFYQVSHGSVNSGLLTPIRDAITARGLEDQIDYISTLGQVWRFTYAPEASTSRASVDHALTNLTQILDGVPGADEHGSRSVKNPLYEFLSTGGSLASDGGTYAAGLDAGVNEALRHSTTYDSGDGIDRQFYMSGQLSFTGQFAGLTADQAIASLTTASTSDGSHPSGTVYFCDAGTGEIRSNIRRPQWEDWVQSALVTRGGSAVKEDSLAPAGHTDVLGAVIGHPHPQIPDNTTNYLPGSFADNLTSFGAHFTRPDQTKSTPLLANGAAATSGTAYEPGGSATQFPHAGIHVLIADGSTLGEAYHKSIYWTGAQTFFGDQLAQPFADLPQVQVVTGPAEGASVSGSVAIQVSASLNAPVRAMSILRMDLYVDGAFIDTFASGSGTFNLDTAILDDGLHQLRITATNDAAAESQGYLVRNVVVDNHGRSVSVVGGDVNLTQDEVVSIVANTIVGDGVVSQVVLRHLGRTVVADVTTGQLHAADLAFGDNRIVPVAIFTDGQEVLGSPIVVNRAPTIHPGQTPLVEDLRRDGVKVEYFLGKGTDSIGSSDFSGTPDLVTTHPVLPTTQASAIAGAEMATTEIDQLAIRVKALFEVLAGDEGEYQFGFWNTNDAVQLMIDGVTVVAYDNMSFGTGDNAGAFGTIYLGPGEHSYELLASNVNRPSDSKPTDFQISGYVRDVHGVTRFIDGDGHIIDPAGFRSDIQAFFELYYEGDIISQIDAVGVDGSQNVTSVTVDGVAYPVDDLIRVSDVTAYQSYGRLAVLVEKNDSPVATGERALVIDGDDSLATGFANLKDDAASLVLEFESRVFNGPGADIILFEFGGGEEFALLKKDGVTNLIVSTTGFNAATVSSDVYGLASGTIPTLNDLETLAFSKITTINNSAVHAVLVDLTDLGYLDGESVTSISMGSNPVVIGSVTGISDLVAAYGLPDTDQKVLNTGTRQWVHTAATDRVDMLILGDSVTWFNSDGWDAGFINAAKDSLGLAGTGLIPLGGVGGQGDGYYHGGASTANHWAQDLSALSAELQGFAVDGQIVSAGATVAHTFGFGISSNSPTLDPTAAYDFHVWTAGPSVGAGTMRGYRRLESTPWTRLETSATVATTQPVSGLQHDVFSFTASTGYPLSQKQGFKLDNTTDTHIFYSRLVSPGVAGVTVSSWGYGGRSSRDFYYDKLMAMSAAGRAQYLSALVDAGSGKLNIVIAQGFNDRNETEPSVNGIVDGSSPEAFADNIGAMVSLLQTAWAEGGHRIEDLSFTLLGMYEIASGNEQMREYAAQLKGMAQADTRLSFVDLFKLAPSYAEAEALGYSYDGLHPSRAGALAYSATALDALLVPEPLPVGTLEIQGLSAGGNPMLILRGTLGQGFSLQASEDLMIWREIENDVFDVTGETLLEDSNSPERPQQFYRWESL